VIYTTHYLEEAERLCDRVAIVDHGRLLAEGTIDELKRRVSGKEIITVTGTFDVEAARSRLAALPGAQVIVASPGKMVLSVAGSGKAAVEALTSVLASGLDLDGVSIQPPSLNSVFLDLTGRELRD
jgi:ABC-2 type transport system ATP-binding protein